MPGTTTQQLACEFSSSQGSQKLRDYDVRFTYIDLQIQQSVQFIFPRIGYLVFNLITGDDFSIRHLNYNKSVSTPNHTYISGLFSGSSLSTRQEGNGGGFAIKIHPVIGYYLLNIPLYPITDRQVLLSDVLKKHGKYLRKMESVEMICTLDNFYLKEMFLDIFPLKRVFLTDPIFHAVNKIISRKGIIRVDELAKEFFMTERTLSRQFKIKVGLSPQAYAKIIRISNAMDLLILHPETSLDQTAFDTGYYDVAHLSRDFREHVSLKPSELHDDLHPMMASYLNFPDSFQNV